ncbi:MAG TPA: MFS transporter [Hyphomicrobiaceae bacterium]|nr:MFS transporter [Hyphomicrobiaceae bacterium]
MRAINAVGLVACSLATTLPMLVSARVLQGVGAALTFACGPAIATALGGEGRRAEMLSFHAMVIAIGSAAGPLVGGMLVDLWGWPAVFWARAPLPLAALLLSSAMSPLSQAPPRGGMDWLNGMLVVLAMAGAGSTLGFAAGTATPLVALLAAVAIVAWWVQGQRSAAPVLDPAHFRQTEFTVLNLSTIAINLVAFAVLLIAPYYLVRMVGLSNRDAGLVLSLPFFGMLAGAWLVPRLTTSLNAGRLAFAGLCSVAVMQGAIGALEATSPMALIMAAFGLHGMGLGVFQVAAATIVTGTLPLEQRGVAGSLGIVMRTIGVVAGAFVLATLFDTMSGTDAVGERERIEAGVAAFKATFIYSSLALAIFILATLAWPRTWHWELDDAARR